MNKSRVLELMGLILEKQGKPKGALSDNTSLREISFRSLDFSELCLRVEEEIGSELNFEAVQLRNIETVKDVCDFLQLAVSEK